MPVFLDQTLTTTYTPKFFSSRLTGSGGKSGILSENLNPANVVDQYNMSSFFGDDDNSRIFDVGVKGFLASLFQRYITSNTSERVLIAKHKIDKDHYGEIFIEIEPQSIKISESRDQNNNIKRNVRVLYNIFVTYCPVQDVGETVVACRDVNFWSADDLVSQFIVPYTENKTMTLFCNEIEDCVSWCEDFAKDLVSKGFFDENGGVDFVALHTYVKNFSIYDAMCDLSKVWQCDISQMFEKVFVSCVLYRNYVSLANPVSKFIKTIGKFRVPIETFKHIYDVISPELNRTDLVNVCNCNLNMLLADTLSSLHKNKADLHTLPTISPMPTVDKFYSHEQSQAISTTDPLVLVQAGAGSGKSSVVLARIDYMIACGVKPEDITVLSFTNVAADHIKERNAKINSMTIASMIHSIYTKNFPKHQLSSIDTLMNAIEINYLSNGMVTNHDHTLVQLLFGVRKNDNSSFLKLSHMVSLHTEDIIKILDTVGQTCLELEIILCYHLIDTLDEPQSVQSKFLIVDEVQDNSVFEFIYILKYVNKHKESLFVVGDGSQTLYEFRASNPKALNMLEGSGVFSTFALQTNYRSNQEVLDLANSLLSTIEANQYANIQLRSNDLTKVTSDSFRQKIHLNYERVGTMKEQYDVLTDLLQSKTSKFIDDKVAKGEQIAFLAFTRREVARAEQCLKDMYPNLSIVSIVPPKTYNSTLFSDYVKSYWKLQSFNASMNPAISVVKGMRFRLGSLINTSKRALVDSADRHMAMWLDQVRSNSQQWHAHLQAGSLSPAQVGELVKDSLLSFEIDNNAVRNAVLANSRDNRRESDEVKNADIILSTIHSAKGLEFDNTIVSYNDSTLMTEERKRLYYVALTRAKNSEFILAFGKTNTSPLVNNYTAIVSALHEREQQAATI